MLVKKLAAHRNLFSKDISKPDGDGDYFSLPDWKYAFSIWGGRRSDVEDIRRYREHFIRKEIKAISKRWHKLHFDYNTEGIGIQVAPNLWENTYVTPGEQPTGSSYGEMCTPGCNYCCCFNFGRVIISKAEFKNLPKRKFHPFDDICPWACREGCSIYKKRPYVCRLWHCKEMPPNASKEYKAYIDLCHKKGAVVINSGVRGIGCSENGFYHPDWKLI